MVFLASFEHGVGVFERVRDRFLEDDVLAGLRRLDHDFAVPVVRNAHHHHVNILALQQLSVVRRRRRDFPLARKLFHVALARRAGCDDHGLGDFLKGLGVNIR